MKELIILKIGGSVLTEKNQPFTARNDVIARLAKEIADGFDAENNRLIFLHGAGSFGHYIVSKTGIHQGIRNKEQLVAFAETQRWQNYWDAIVTEALQKEGIPAMPCQASSHAIMDKGRLVWMPVDTIRSLVDIDMVPVLYGVPAYDKAQKCSILSGDQIAAHLARELGVKKIIHCTDVDGIFTGDPKKDPRAKLIKEITPKNIDEVKNYLTVSSAIDVTGGMFGKVTELLSLAKSGVVSEIINANKEGYVKRALSGESGLGTIVRL